MASPKSSTFTPDLRSSITFGRLQITMDDSFAVRLRPARPRSELPRRQRLFAAGAGPRARRASSVSPSTSSMTITGFPGEIVYAVNGTYMRMIQARKRRTLRVRTARPTVSGRLVPQGEECRNFSATCTAELQILGAIDHAHAAAAQLVEHPEVRKGRPPRDRPRESLAAPPAGFVGINLRGGPPV